MIALEKYIDLRDKEDEVIYRQDPRFVEERLENEIRYSDKENIDRKKWEIIISLKSFLIFTYK